VTGIKINNLLKLYFLWCVRQFPNSLMNIGGEKTQKGTGCKEH